MLTTSIYEINELPAEKYQDIQIRETETVLAAATAHLRLNKRAALLASFQHANDDHEILQKYYEILKYF